MPSLRMTRNWFSACRNSSDMVTALSFSVSWSHWSENLGNMRSSGRNYWATQILGWFKYVEIQKLPKNPEGINQYPEVTCCFWNKQTDDASHRPRLAWPGSPDVVWRPGWATPETQKDVPLKRFGWQAPGTVTVQKVQWLLSLDILSVSLPVFWSKERHDW